MNKHLVWEVSYRLLDSCGKRKFMLKKENHWMTSIFFFFFKEWQIENHWALLCQMVTKQQRT